MIQQDKNRIEKKLYSSHPTGTLPVLQKYDDADKEADGIASQITTLTEDLGSELVRFCDFVESGLSITFDRIGFTKSWNSLYFQRWS